MYVEEADKSALKAWVIPRLEKISEADASVLADYVIALVSPDEPEDAKRQNCLDSLSDFLHDNAAPFVDEVMSALKTKSFIPKPKATASAESSFLPSPALSAEAPPFNPPTGPSALSAKALPFKPPTGPSGLTKNQSTLPGLGTGALHNFGEGGRKRRYNECDSSQPRDTHEAPSKRVSLSHTPFKPVTRRGGQHGRSAFPTANNGPMMPAPAMPGPMPLPPMPSFPSMPTPPQGYPPFDPATALPLLSMMQMGLPGMPPGISPGLLPTKAHPTEMGTRCNDYDTKGYCALGSVCPYEHGGEIVLAPEEEYDPTKALFSSGSGQAKQRGRREHVVIKGGRARAPFSHLGPTSDRSNTAVVVEQIPEENFAEDQVRAYFSEFGNIVNVDMQAYKRLAIVKYDDHSAARRAYDSPKAIFGNRFVKVYWYKPETLPAPPVKRKDEADEEMVDPEEVAKRQAEAQKAFEERQKKMQETETRINQVEQELQEKVEELSRLRQELAKRAKSGASENGDLLSTQDDLLNKLALLQDEAQTLNADHDANATRGRGGGSGYRGRGTYLPRGRGYTPFRGGYRGTWRGYRGSPFAAGRSTVKRLDNRPRRIAVSGVEVGSPQDEALRQFLVNYEYDSIEPHPDNGNTQIITFKERYMAEEFSSQASSIPDIGKIELSWVPNAAPTRAEQSSDQPGFDGDTKMGEVTNAEEENAEDLASSATLQGDDQNENAAGDEADYDVAEENDRWMGA